MPTQMGYIDLSATNSVMLAAEAGWSSDLEDYATKADLTVSANSIKSEVSETYATKIEVQRTDTGSGAVVSSDDAANLPPLSLTIHGKSVQDGTPSPSSPVEIRSVEGRNILKPTVRTVTSGGVTYTCTEDGLVTLKGTSSLNNWFTLKPASTFPAGTYTASKTGGTSEIKFGNTAAPKITKTYSANWSSNDLAVYVYKDAVYDESFYVQLERGSTAHDYQPYGYISEEITGKNLLDVTLASQTKNGITITVGDDGGIAISGTSTNLVEVTVGAMTLYGDVTMSGVPANSFGGSVRLQLKQGGSAVALQYNGTPVTKLDASGAYTVTLVVLSGLTVDMAIYPQLEYGSTATEYEPYQGTTTPIPLNGNALRSVTDGTEDVLVIDSEGNVTLTQRVKRLDFTASTVWGKEVHGSTNNYYTDVISDAIPNSDLLLTFSKHSHNGVADGNSFISTTKRLNVGCNSIATAAEFATATAGGYLLYPLATPQTISLGKIDLPSLPSPSFSLHVDAAVTPTLDAEWWTQGGEEVGSVYQRTSALEQNAEGLSVRMSGLETDAVLKSKDEWTAWLDVGTDSDNNPFLAMGQSGNDLNSRLSNESMSFYNGTEELMKLSGADGVKADTVRSKRVYIGSWILEELDSGDMAIKLVGGGA